MMIFIHSPSSNKNNSTLNFVVEPVYMLWRPKYPFVIKRFTPLFGTRELYFGQENIVAV